MVHKYFGSENTGCGTVADVVDDEETIRSHTAGSETHVTAYPVVLQHWPGAFCTAFRRTVTVTGFVLMVLDPGNDLTGLLKPYLETDLTRLIAAPYFVFMVVVVMPDRLF
jgi:hypothetical protein